MEINGLVSRSYGGFGHPVSRDWDMDDFQCSATSCVNNRAGLCSIPTLFNIGEDGRCTGFILKMEKN